ncbi:MAG: hypothetical protein FH748_12380 [Balneolaceae bacterium]|nr:hypothetical protein [Balneolaceae bacterium]
MKYRKHLFISDVHLGAFPTKINAQIEEDLICLINHCIDERYRIYVLGDLFDYWMEYPEKGFVPALGRKVLDAFEKYNHTVEAAVFITGNHDNWTFGHFAKRGFDIEHNFRLTQIQQKRLLLMHGDGVAASKIDFPRAAFHRLLRSNSFVNAYQTVLPPRQGLAAMKMFSSFSKKNNYLNPEPLNRQAKKIFNKHNLDFILSGHDHIPREETFRNGTYINLGTFFKHRSLAVFEDNKLSLSIWDADTKSLLPFSSMKKQA